MVAPGSSDFLFFYSYFFTSPFWHYFQLRVLEFSFQFFTLLQKIKKQSAL